MAVGGKRSHQGRGKAVCRRRQPRVAHDALEQQASEVVVWDPAGSRPRVSGGMLRSRPLGGGGGGGGGEGLRAALLREAMEEGEHLVLRAGKPQLPHPLRKILVRELTGGELIERTE